MSFEQPIYSFNHPGGEPPTPTTPNYFLDSFQTPKQDSRFHDPRSPWSVAFASTLSPELKAQASCTSPGKSPVTPSHGSKRKGKHVAVESSFNVHLSPSMDQSLPSVALSHPPSSAAATSTAAETSHARLQASQCSLPPYVSFGSDYDSGILTNPASSMQTPPPTSTSASRRKAQQAQLGRFGETPTTKKGKKAMSPTTAIRYSQDVSIALHEESPSHFPTLQFSPDGFTFPMSGPATAPVYPQQKLFWEQDQNAGHLNLDLPMDDTFSTFGMGLTKNPGPFTFVHDQSDALQFGGSGPSVVGTGTDHVRGFNVSSHADALNQTNVSSSTAIMTQGSSRHGGTVVNPSLLFSSPGRAPEIARSPPKSQTAQNDTLRPYALQLRDAQMEKESRERKPKRKRAPENDSPAVAAALEALREDLSEVSSPKSPLIDSFSAPASTRLPDRIQRGPHRYGLDGAHPYGRRHGSQSLINRRKSENSIANRTAITLKIDPNGRAVTETTVVASTKSSHNGVETETESGESDSGSSSSSAGMITSHTQSFYNPSPKHKYQKLRHSVDDRNVDNYSQRPSSTGPHRKLPESRVHRTPSNVRMGSRNRSLGHNRKSSYIQEDENESEAETIIDSDDEKGDAQSELKKVVRDRTQTRASSRSSRLAPNFSNSRRPQTTFAPPANPYYTTRNAYPGHLEYQDPYSNLSPTTITDPDMTTPSSGRESNFSSGTTRCICNCSDGNGQLMIQCESCKNWQHTDCVNLNPQNLPNVYLCAACTDSPYGGRGGRMRDGLSRNMFLPPSSPLAHKSQRSR